MVPGLPERIGQSAKKLTSQAAKEGARGLIFEAIRRGLEGLAAEPRYGHCDPVAPELPACPAAPPCPNVTVEVHGAAPGCLPGWLLTPVVLISLVLGALLGRCWPKPAPAAPVGARRHVQPQ